MNTSTPSTGPAIYCRRAAALLLMCGLLGVLSPPASAQLGSLVVSITSPAAGATVHGTVPINASVTIVGFLLVAKVEFYRDGVLLGEDTSAPYSLPWNTTTTGNGSHVLTAIARTPLLVGFDSPWVAVTVANDSIAPTVGITAPSAGSSLRGVVNVNATAADNVAVTGVQFRLDGVNLGAEDTTVPYSIAWTTTTAANGSHSLTAVARDGVGNTATAASVAVVVDNTAPAVSVTSPTAGALARGAITVTADASDNLALAGVQFLVDGLPLGAEDVVAPFTAAWDTASSTNASHTVSAVARDAAGNATTSAGITLTVDNAAPAIAITSPSHGSTVSGSATVTASATDNLAVAAVQFLLDGAMLGVEDSSAPYNVDWNSASVSNGTHALTAVARDTAGNSSTSATVSVTVANDTTAPAVAISAPAGGATVAASVTVTATATDNVGVTGVRFLVDGAQLGAEVTAEPYAVTWDTTAATDGPHSLTAIARDAAGNTTASAAVNVTVANQAEATTRIEDSNPAITYTPEGWMLGYTDSRPWSGGSAALGFNAVHRATLSFTGTGVRWIGFRGPQTGIAKVHLDGALVATVDAYSPTEMTQVALYAVTGLVNGPHTLLIEVTRTKNDAASDFYVVIDAFDVTAPGSGTPDTAPPSVSVTSPAGGAAVSGTVPLAASASDNVGVIGVRFFVDGAQVGAEDTSAPYEASWNTATANEGSHTVSAQARDAAGNTTTSAAVTVTVSNADATPPGVAITSPAGGATVFGTTTVTANATDNTTVAGVQFFVDGVPLGAEDTAAPYSAAWDTTTAANGSHVLTATARDGAGNTAAAPAVTVSVANGAGSTIRIEDGNTAIAYGGSWNLGNNSRPWSGGTAALGFGLGQEATVTFSGTGITWIGFQGPWAGIAKVYVDGVFAATIDGYATAEVVQATVFTAGGLSLGQHTLTIEVTRTKNASSADYIVIVDAFDITGAPPDSTPPTVSITSPAGGTTVFGTIPVRAGADDDRGVSSVTFFVDGVQIGVPDSISPYAINWNTATVADGPHTLTAAARDAAGNTSTSAPVTVTVANAAPPALAAATRIENTDLGIIYVDGCNCGQPPAWYHGSRSRAWSDGTASFNRAEGGRATYTFSGTAVRWIGFRAAWAGIGRVFVDGALVGEVDLFSPTEEVQGSVFQVTDLAPGTHTIAVESTGRKNPDSSDYAVVVDAFDVSPAMPPPVTGTRSEESAASATYTAGWNRSDTTHAWSGGTAAVASGVAERATFVFTGTAVQWLGKRGPDMGIARVYLDGAFQGQVDTYYPSTIQGLIYGVTTLAPGEHRLEIEVTGLRHTQSTGNAIAIDAFDVRSRLEENDAPVSYTGTWTFNDTSRNWSDTSLTTGTGTAALASTAGARAEATFTGTAVTWIGLRGPMAGIADVYLDGTFAQRVDLYSATEQVQAPLFTASALAPGPHTLRVEATGTRNPAATTSRVFVDAFDVTVPTPAPPVTRVQETDASIAYSPGWATTGGANLWSGERARQSGTVGAQATLTFTGTSVRWISERGFATGVARVSIDGQFIAVVDLRTPFQEEYQEPVFIARGLAPGAHTLTIEVVGRNNEAAGTAVEPIVIDAFDISQQ